jgi:hypothetical protein
VVGHKAGQSSKSSVEIKNEWRCNSTPPYAVMTCIGTTLPSEYVHMCNT